MNSRLRPIIGIVNCLAFSHVLAAPLFAEDGPTLYKQLCASCHDTGTDRAPNRDALRAMSPERVLAALERGAMLSMAAGRTGVERRAIAEFVTGKSFAQALSTTPSPQAMCARRAGDFANPLSGSRWNGWGVDTSNTRYQDGSQAGFTAADVSRLKPKWAFGFPGELSADAHPTIAGGRVFVGTQTGTVYALERRDRLRPLVLSAPKPPCARPSASAASTRALARASRHSSATAPETCMRSTAPAARCCGRRRWTLFRSPASPARRRFTTAGSMWAWLRAKRRPVRWPSYECCRFRGSLVALDAATGAQVWKTYTIEEARPTTKNKIGTQLWGPSGVPIWSSPAIDVQRNAIYVTTGNNYSGPATSISDAFVAFDMSSGKILWSRQMTAGDDWNTSCRLPDKINCTNF